MTYQTIAFAVLSVAYFVYKYLTQTDVPKIKGLPEIPGVPVFGNLFQLGDKHAKVAGEWAKKYGPVFQTRLGNRRVIFANSYEAVKELWIKNQSALISRPTLHTFHTVVSSSQGFTIGTSPWDESCKARRKAAATALNKPAVQSYMPIIDVEATTSIKELYHDTEGGKKDINPIAYFQRFALNTSLTLNYGFRIQGNIDDDLLKEITTVERLVSNFRSTSNNWADYLPFIRPFTNFGSGPAEARKRSFDAQSKDYKLSCIPDGIPAMSVEVMSTLGWEKYSHEQFGLNRFGVSGPYKDVYKKFEFTPEGISKRALQTIDFYKEVKPLRSPLNRAFTQLI